LYQGANRLAWIQLDSLLLLLLGLGVGGTRRPRRLGVVEEEVAVDLRTTSFSQVLSCLGEYFSPSLQRSYQLTKISFHRPNKPIFNDPFPDLASSSSTHSRTSHLPREPSASPPPMPSSEEPRGSMDSWTSSDDRMLEGEEHTPEWSVVSEFEREDGSSF